MRNYIITTETLSFLIEASSQKNALLIAFEFGDLTEREIVTITEEKGV
jgi:hypothetical protein